MNQNGTEVEVSIHQNLKKYPYKELRALVGVEATWRLQWDGDYVVLDLFWRAPGIHEQIQKMLGPKAQKNACSQNTCFAVYFYVHL